jgi:CheY-like chemotaxis protein
MSKRGLPSGGGHALVQGNIKRKNAVKMLVADDDHDSRTLLAELLFGWGHQVASVADGQEAWKTLTGQNAPQLVILDWIMPGIDGLELCRRLRKTNLRNPPYIILLTSKTEPRDTVAALEAGANDYVRKPYDCDELRARIQVGCRMLYLQGQLRNQERLEGILQMACTVCHELNQPLQIVLSSAESLLANLPPHDSHYEALIMIRDGVQRLGDVTRRIMSATDVRTHEYLGEANRIIDLAEVPLTSPPGL